MYDLVANLRAAGNLEWEAMEEMFDCPGHMRLSGGARLRDCHDLRIGPRLHSLWGLKT
jgi:hypothetical protein